MNENMNDDIQEEDVQEDVEFDENDFYRIKSNESAKKRALYEARKKIEEHREEMMLRKLSDDYYFDSL